MPLVLRVAECQESDVARWPVQNGRPGETQTVPTAGPEGGRDLPVAVEVILRTDRASLRDEPGKQEKAEEPPREHGDDDDADDRRARYQLPSSRDRPADRSTLRMYGREGFSVACEVRESASAAAELETLERGRYRRRRTQDRTCLLPSENAFKLCSRRRHCLSSPVR